MAHMAILEDELEAVPEVLAYLPEAWLQGDMQALDLWLGDQNTLEGLTPGTPFRSILSRYDSVRTRWLHKVRHDIASFGDVLVCRHHGWYFLGAGGISMRRAASLELLAQALRDLDGYDPRLLFTRNDGVIWDFLLAVGLCAYTVTGDAADSAEHALSTLEARFVQWREENEWLFSEDTWIGSPAAAELAESWEALGWGDYNN